MQDRRRPPEAAQPVRPGRVRGWISGRSRRRGGSPARVSCGAAPPNGYAGCARAPAPASAPRRATAVRDGVTAPRRGRAPAGASLDHLEQVEDALRHHRQAVLLVVLQDALHVEVEGVFEDASVLEVDVVEHDHLGELRLVLEGEEEGAMPRADPRHLGALQHAGQAHAAAVRHVVQLVEGGDAQGADLLAQEGQRVGAHVEAQDVQLGAHPVFRTPGGEEAERRQLVGDQAEGLAGAALRPGLRRRRRLRGRPRAPRVGPPPAGSCLYAAAPSARVEDGQLGEQLLAARAERVEGAHAHQVLGDLYAGARALHEVGQRECTAGAAGRSGRPSGRRQAGAAGRGGGLDRWPCQESDQVPSLVTISYHFPEPR